MKPPSPVRIAAAAHCLAAGGIVAYPAEGVWGLGCDPDNRDAVLALLALKQRPVEKGLILVAASMQQFAPWLGGLTDAEREQLSASWPGPITWVVPHSGRSPDWIRGDNKGVALRVSAHPLIAALCERFGGPLVSTSANPTGRPPARSVLRVRRYFGARLDAVLNGALGGADGPTPIRTLRGGAWVRRD